MSDRIKKIKIKQADGTFSDYIPIGANAKDIDLQYNDSNVENTLKKKPYYYDNVATMKLDDTLREGDMAITLGYYEANDGGGAEYIISENENSYHQEVLNSGLYATLIIKNGSLNIKQLGAKSEQDSEYNHIDIKPYLDIYENLVGNNKMVSIKLYIPGGIYVCSEKLFNTSGVDIYGELQFYHNWNMTRGTIITSLNESQRYIWKLGGYEDFTYDTAPSVKRDINIMDLTFSSGVYSSSGLPNSLNEITKSALYIDSIDFGLFPRLFFNYIYGTALGISTSWELYFDAINFRNIYDHDSPVFLLDSTHIANGVSSPNISACNFGNIMFEVCNGDYIKFDQSCGFDNNHIGYINAECSFGNDYQDTGTSGAAELDGDNYIHHSIFRGGQCVQLTIDSICIQLIGNYYHTINNNTYVIDRIFDHEDAPSSITSFAQGSYFNVSIGTIDYELNRLPIYLVYQNCSISYKNKISINMLKTMSQNNNSYPLLHLYQYNGNIIVNNLVPVSESSYFNYGDIINNFLYYPCANFSSSGYNTLSVATDEESINPLHMIVKSFENNGDTSVMSFNNFKFNKIHLRINIPSGENMQLFFSNGEHSGNFAPVAGEGIYKWYEFDFTDKEIDDTNRLLLSTGSKTSKFDCLYFE